MSISQDSRPDLSVKIYGDPELRGPPEGLQDILRPATELIDPSN